MPAPKKEKYSIKPFNLYRTLLSTHFAQKYEKPFTGFCEGGGMAIGMFFLDRYLGIKKTSAQNISFLSFCKSFITQKPTGLITNIFKSSIQLSLIYTMKDPFLDALNAANPMAYNEKVSYGFAALFAKSIVYPASVCEFLRYNNYSYQQISQFPIETFYKGYPATAFRDFACFPLLLYMRDFIPAHSNLDANDNAILIGFMAGLTTWPIAAPLSAVGEWQRVYHQNAISTIKELYKTGGLPRFFRGSVGSASAAAMFGLLFNEAQKITRNAKEENAKGLKL